jgi:peroxiredoxin Q/BCP
VVFGVNPADQKSHATFSEKNNFQFPLLIDAAHTVIAGYKCKGALGTKRTVYVIDKNGIIIFAQRGKPPVSEILGSIEADKKKIK